MSEICSNIVPHCNPFDHLLRQTGKNCYSKLASQIFVLKMSRHMVDTCSHYNSSSSYYLRDTDIYDYLEQKSK